VVVQIILTALLYLGLFGTPFLLWLVLRKVMRLLPIFIDVSTRSAKAAEHAAEIAERLAALQEKPHAD
jgi:hypothetical protein